MKRYITLFFLLINAGLLLAQGPMVTKNGTTSFFSHSPIEDIEAINKKTTAAIDFSKGNVVVKMLIKHFAFENALMQEHFNENYMESEKFPAAIFKGKIDQAESIDPTLDGDYNVSLKGTLTIHGVTKPLDASATISIVDGKVTANTKFIARPADFDIEIPSVVVKNIAEEIEVTSVLSFPAPTK